MDSDREVFLLNQERERLWNLIRSKEQGEMGPSWVFVRDIREFFQPEASAE